MSSTSPRTHKVNRTPQVAQTPQVADRAKPRRTATLRDVAKQAGVSICTASKILNRKDNDRFTKDTHQRVQQAAAAINYLPSHMARALVGGRSMTIGLIVKGMGTLVADQRMRHLIETAQTHGYLTCVDSIQHLGDDSELVSQAVRQMMSRGVDGLVIQRSMPVSPKVRRELDALPVPVVHVGWGPATSSRRIIVDIQSAMEATAAHLSSLGHRHVTYFPPRGQMDFPEQKILLYTRAMAKHGVKLLTDRRWFVDEVAHDLNEAVPKAIHAFLQSSSPATALLMSNDQTALMAMDALKKAGVSVPHDMSVVGYDDLFFAHYTDPPLTTLAKPPAELIGQATFAMLHQLMLDPTAVVHKQIFHGSLTLRESTAEARVLIRRKLETISSV